MNRFIQIKDTIKLFDDSTVKLITEEIIKITPNTKSNILKIISKYPIDKKFIDQLLEIKVFDLNKTYTLEENIQNQMNILNLNPEDLTEYKNKRVIIQYI